MSEILDRINRSTGRFEREAVEAAIERREEITPELMQILQKLLRVLENAPEMYAEIDPLGDYTAHLYAMFLLGEFQETRAHDLLLRFGSLPSKLLDRVCGDFLDSEFLYALERTAESTTGIRHLIEDRTVDERVRLGALESLERLVRFGRLRRAKAVLCLRELFHGKLERVRSELWDCLVGSALHLEAAELLPEIRLACEEGLVSPEFNLEEIEEGLSQDLSDVDRALSQEFPGMRRPPLDHLTGNGWWRRTNRNG